MATRAKSAAHRVAAYERRMKRRSMVKKHVWVPQSEAETLNAVAAAMRAGKRPAGDDLARGIQALRELRPLAERLGILHAQVFGSVARGEARADSDLDVVISFRDPSTLDLFGYLRARRELAEALGRIVGRTVDVIETGSLEAGVKERIRREAVDAY